MASQPWWVLKPSVVSRGQQPFTVVQSATRPPGTGVSQVAAGPFATKADAEAWIAAQTAGPPLPSVPNPFSGVASVADGIAKVGGLISGFFSVLTDASLWRSIGWIAFGVVLVIIGLYLWLKGQDVIPDVVPVPV